MDAPLFGKMFSLFHATSRQLFMLYTRESREPMRQRINENYYGTGRTTINYNTTNFQTTLVKVL